ncbi:MAG: hypothetical protein D6815_00270, partial [Candidatus Dadabacteria bacterium]
PTGTPPNDTGCFAQRKPFVKGCLAFGDGAPRSGAAATGRGTLDEPTLPDGAERPAASHEVMASE